MSEEAPQVYKTRLSRRISKMIKRALMRIAVWTVPYIYVAYMWFVYKTSRVEEVGCLPSLARENCGQGVYAIWHDEVFFVAWAFGKYHPHTLASRGVAVSTGSACAERDARPSPAIAALGLGPSWGLVRVSFGHDTTEDDVRAGAEILAEAVADLAAR